MLGAVLDRGVTLIDTARSYGRAEERIGKYPFRASPERVLPCSHQGGLRGSKTSPTGRTTRSRAGIDEALVRLRTDATSSTSSISTACAPRNALEQRGDVMRALHDAQGAGKIRLAAYSGENEALDFAVSCGAFGSIQCSVNLFDQRALDGAIPRAKACGMGVIAKRALANVPWRFKERPHGNYCEVYWDRMQAMTPDPHIRAEMTDEHWAMLALYFSAFAPGVDFCARRHAKPHAPGGARQPRPRNESRGVRSRHREHRAPSSGARTIATGSARSREGRAPSAIRLTMPCSVLGRVVTRSSSPPTFRIARHRPRSAGRGDQDHVKAAISPAGHQHVTGALPEQLRAMSGDPLAGLSLSDRG